MNTYVGSLRAWIEKINRRHEPSLVVARPPMWVRADIDALRAV